MPRSPSLQLFLQLFSVNEGVSAAFPRALGERARAVAAPGHIFF